MKEEDDDDPNDMLPFKRAATVEQKKLMDAVEQQTTADINTAAFQAKIGRKHNRAAESSRSRPVDRTCTVSSRCSGWLVVSTTVQSDVCCEGQCAVRFTVCLLSSWCAVTGSSARHTARSAQASIDCIVDVLRPSTRELRDDSSSSGAAHVSRMMLRRVSSRLSRRHCSSSKLQELRVAIAKAIPLYGRLNSEGGGEEKEQMLHAPTLAKVAKAAALQAAVQRAGAGKNDSGDRRQGAQRRGKQLAAGK